MVDDIHLEVGSVEPTAGHRIQGEFRHILTDDQIRATGIGWLRVEVGTVTDPGLATAIVEEVLVAVTAIDPQPEIGIGTVVVLAAVWTVTGPATVMIDVVEVTRIDGQLRGLILAGKKDQQGTRPENVQRVRPPVPGNVMYTPCMMLLQLYCATHTN